MAKATEFIALHRTDGNDDPLVVKLTRIDDGDVTTNVPDSATVKMDVSTSLGIVTINGTAVGDSSGRFQFAVATLPTGASILPFDVDVTESGVYTTYGRGEIITSEKIGT